MSKVSQLDKQATAKGGARSCFLALVVCLSVAALVASLATKTVSLENGRQTSIRAGGDGVKQQKFEPSGLEWSVPVAICLPELWPVEVARVTVVAEPLISFQFDDSLYIRPPPVQS